MKLAYKALIATFVIVASLGSAAASPADLTIFPKESSTEINSFTSYEVEVENVGPVKDVYSFSSKTDEVSIAPRQVELEPGASETINVWYNPEVTKEEGTYSFSVTADSRATGKTYSVDGVVNVIKDHKVDVSVERSSRTGCIDQKVTYNVEVTNNGLQKETFQLRTDYGELNMGEVTLEDGETKTVTLTASGSEPMQENFNVVAASKTSYAQDIKSLQFNSEICYASDVTVTPETKDVAAYTSTDYKVTVRNTGTKADEFILSTSKGSLGTTELDIDGKSSKSTTLSVTPEKLGKQRVTLTAKSTVESSETATMNVYNGMDVDASFDMDRRTVCEDGSTTYEVTVENTGETSEEFSLSTNRGELSAEKVSLDTGETTTVDLGVDATELKEGRTYSIDVTTTAETFGTPVTTESADLKVNNCWDLEMNIVPKVASAGENRSVIYEIQMENPGTKENTYELAYEGPSWVEIKPGQVTVPAGGEETSYMYAGIPFEKQGRVQITATAVGNQVEDSETVQLVIDEDIKKAIKQDKRRGGITGAFSNAVSDLADSVGTANNPAKILISLIVGALITAAVLFREW